MKNTFIEYNPLEQGTLKKLWDEAIFVFDTNVLLNLYRYSEQTSKKFLETIIRFKERVWLPYQVGLEFNRHRLGVISDQRRHYEDFEKKINDLISEIENKDRNPFLSEPLCKKLVTVKNDIKYEVDVKVKMYDQALNSDMLLEKINAAFEGRIGNYFTDKELKDLHTEGERRYKEKIPPGYLDLKKPENEKFGDLIIWKQIILKARDAKIDIIFILDDRKEDWWLDHRGKTISPRPELLKEFRVETGNLCHFYRPFQFLEYSNEYLGHAIKEEVIAEVKNYKPESTDENNFIQINLTLQGSPTDVTLFTNDLKGAGYNILTELDTVNDFHNLCIFLPNIPDLERRLTARYFSDLGRYNLKIVSVNKN